MKKTKNFGKNVIDILIRLHTEYPNMSIGDHLSVATEGYPSLEISDKELLYALTKYETELSLGETFDSSFNEDYEEEDNNDIL